MYIHIYLYTPRTDDQTASEEQERRAVDLRPIMLRFTFAWPLYSQYSWDTNYQLFWCDRFYTILLRLYQNRLDFRLQLGSNIIPTSISHDIPIPSYFDLAKQGPDWEWADRGEEEVMRSTRWKKLWSRPRKNGQNEIAQVTPYGNIWQWGFGIWGKWWTGGCKPHF